MVSRQKLADVQPGLFQQDAPVDTLAFENMALSRGFQYVAGIDEAGRGPLAGPVVAAAVILSPGCFLAGVDDSKKLSPPRREELFDVITQGALSVGIGIVDSQTIDRINILQATLLAMKTAIQELDPPPDLLLIDGISKVPLPLQQMTIVKGDSVSLSISAASIIAKVTRDRLLLELDTLYPLYGFAEHKGYGTRKHLAAIARHGPTPEHRLSFRGVKEHVHVDN